jgi:hypothetical protein
MGLGKLGCQNMIFVRKFRFSLEGPNIPDWVIKAAHVNLAKKQLFIKAYELVEAPEQAYKGQQGSDSPIELWAKSMEDGRWPDETIKLTVWDGCGKGLYAYTFSGLKLASRELDFDMASSEEVLQEIVMEYQVASRQFFLEPCKYKWRFLLEGAKEEIDVEIPRRPRVDIDETEIDFLHGKLFVAGKYKWQTMKMFINNSDLPHSEAFLKLINSAKEETTATGLIRLYDDSGKLCEAWKLENLWANYFNKNDKYCEIDLRYNHVQYFSFLSQDDMKA